MSTNNEHAEGAVVPLTVKGTRAAGHGVSRREAMQWVMGAVAASAMTPETFGQEVGRTSAPQELASRQPPPVFSGGYGTDPKMVHVYKPGELWPLTFTDSQKLTVRTLADIILPKDQYGPAASEVGVVEMIDEWISAPYPIQQADRPVILEGLAWLDTESTKRFDKNFVELSERQQRAICDDICYTADAKPELQQGAAFFSRFRSLCASAYYATPPGWEAIGYVGNVALERFDGPPAEVLEKLGVTQTVG